MRVITHTLFLVIAGFFFLSAPFTHAASLTFVRDGISASAPSATSTHTIQFTATQAIPASGKIEIVLQDGAFTIPSGFGIEDVDFGYSTTSTGAYVERDIATVPSATEDGVTIVTGTSGSVTITLSSSSGIAAGDRVQIKLGTNAVFGASGDSLIEHPPTTGSYRVTILTKNASDGKLDDAGTRIAVTAPVGLSASPPALPPERSNGLPSGTIAAGNSTIEISLRTNEPAHCRYATSTDVLYADMVNNFSQTYATTHTKVISGHQNDTSYTYYVRCADVQGTENEDDYPISFTLKPTPDSSTSQNSGSTGSSGTVVIPGPGGGGPGGQGGSGNVVNGSERLYTASVTISGFAAPLSSVQLLRDGTPAKSIQSRADGTFQIMEEGLERGTYTFITYMTDSRQRVSGRFSSTLTLAQGTNNTISNVTLPPTMVLSGSEIDPADTLVITGSTVPGRLLDIFIEPLSAEGAEVITLTASSSLGTPTIQSGEWSATVPGGTLKKGTYRVRARTYAAENSNLQENKSSFTQLTLGVGEPAPPDLFLRADINKDTKVNLVDFSILLTGWGGSDSEKDINEDGRVNLSDFSIMLFYWTG